MIHRQRAVGCNLPFIMHHLIQSRHWRYQEDKDKTTRRNRATSEKAEAMGSITTGEATSKQADSIGLTNVGSSSLGSSSSNRGGDRGGVGRAGVDVVLGSLGSIAAGVLTEGRQGAGRFTSGG